MEADSSGMLLTASYTEKVIWSGARLPSSTFFSSDITLRLPRMIPTPSDHFLIPGLAGRRGHHERDDREEEKKAQREAEEREIPVRMDAIDVHDTASVVVSSRTT